MSIHQKRYSAIIDGPLAVADISAASLITSDHGAIASFIGVVRNHHHSRGVTHLFYDCYRPMAESMLRDLITETAQRCDPDLNASIHHGIGHMRPGDISLAIHVATAHRIAAFDACRHLLERIKQDLPVWKQEYYSDGTNAWLKGS